MLAFAAQSLPPMVQAVVILGVGIVSTLMAVGIIPASLDPAKAHKWRQRYGSKFIIGGPLVILVGLFMLVKALWL